MAPRHLHSWSIISLMAKDNFHACDIEQKLNITRHRRPVNRNRRVTDTGYKLSTGSDTYRSAKRSSSKFSGSVMVLISSSVKLCGA